MFTDTRHLSWKLFVLSASFTIGSFALKAHPAHLTSAILAVKADGSFKVELQFDALAFVIDDIPERIPDSALNELIDSSHSVLESKLAEARARFCRGLEIDVDGARVPFELGIFPTAAQVLQAKDSGTQPRFPLMLNAGAIGRVKPGPHKMALRFSEVIGNLVITVEAPGREPLAEPIQAGEATRPFDIEVNAEDGNSRDRNVVFCSWAESFKKFVVLGFEHILPEGLDHILFVLGLFLLSTSMRALLYQITAFTL